MIKSIIKIKKILFKKNKKTLKNKYFFIVYNFIENCKSIKHKFDIQKV